MGKFHNSIKEAHKEFIEKQHIFFVSTAPLSGDGRVNLSPKGLDSLGQMKDSAIRLTSLEHPLINIIAIVLITIGWSKHKKVANNLKFQKIMIFCGLGLLLILSRIPWSLWLG